MNRDGQVVHDYHSLLDFGDQFKNRSFRCRTRSTRWGANELGPPVRFWWLAEPKGLARPPVPSTNRSWGRVAWA